MDKTLTGWRPVWFSPVEHYWINNGTPYNPVYHARCSSFIQAVREDFYHTESDYLPRTCLACKEMIENGQ